MLRPMHDAELVLHRRLAGGGDGDAEYLVADRLDVGLVDEAGIRLAERDLPDHELDVVLVADHVLQHGCEAEVAEKLRV